MDTTLLGRLEIALGKMGPDDDLVKVRAADLRGLMAAARLSPRDALKRARVAVDRPHDPDFWADCAENRCPHGPDPD